MADLASISNWHMALSEDEQGKLLNPGDRLLVDVVHGWKDNHPWHNSELLKAQPISVELANGCIELTKCVILDDGFDSMAFDIEARVCETISQQDSVLQLFSLIHGELSKHGVSAREHWVELFHPKEDGEGYYVILGT